MKCFFFGLLGAFVAMLLGMVIAPQYSDYRAVAETSAWLVDLAPVQEEIARKAAGAGSVSDVAVGVALPEFKSPRPFMSEIRPDGSIYVKGGRQGQVLLLLPVFENGKIRWRCVGGPDVAVPIKCRLASKL